jgi:large subunit ribosomal protein L9
MEVILKKYHKGLGEKNDIVAVKAGFARNFLIPQGIAVLATDTAKKVRTEEIKQAAHRTEHLLKEAQATAAKLEQLNLTVETLAGPDGKLFGSVTSNMVAQQLEAKGITVDRQRVGFEAPIKNVGAHTVIIDLHKDVKAKLNIDVVAASK